MTGLHQADERAVPIVASLVTAQMAKSHAEDPAEVQFFHDQTHAILSDAAAELDERTVIAYTTGFLTALIEHYSEEVGQSVFDTLEPIADALTRHPDPASSMPVLRAVQMVLDPAAAEAATGVSVSPSVAYADRVVVTLTIIDGLMAELATVLSVSPMDMVQIFFSTGEAP